MISFSRKAKKILGAPEVFFIELLLFVVLIISEFLFGNRAFKINNAEESFAIFQHVLIGFFSINILMFARPGFLTQALGLFSLVSFSIFPIIEIGSNTIYWGGSNLEIESRIFTNFVILGWMILFVVASRSLPRFSLKFIKFRFDNYLNSVQTMLLIAVGYLVLFLVLYMYNWDLESLLYRGGENRQEMNTDIKSTYLLVEFFLRPLAFNIGLYIIMICCESRLIFLASLGLMLVSAFPTGIPRFLATTLYLPIILNWFLRRGKIHSYIENSSGNFLPNLLFFGLVVFMPLLDVFRSFSSFNNVSFSVINLNSMLAGHFDGYQMMVRALELGDITFGFGFFGALFFFVPRSVWESKPVGSAQEVARISDLDFDNVSMPLIAEFYLNFWYFGLIIGAVMLGVLIRSIDSKFLIRKNYNVSMSWLIYFESIGLLLLVLRGSVLSAFAYLVAVFSGWIVIYLIKKIG